MATFLLVSLGAADEAQTLDRLVQSAVQPDDRHQIEAGKWLIQSSKATSKDVSDSIGITELLTSTDPVTFLITPVRGYFGLAKPDVWEWLAAKSQPAHA